MHIYDISIARTRPNAVQRGANQSLVWAEAMDEVLLSNYLSRGVKWCTEEVNARFGLNLSRHAIIGRAYRLNLCRARVRR